MHASALSVLATVERATVVDDGLEPVRTWSTLGTLSGMLTPASLTYVQRVGLRAEEVTHSFVVGHGITFDLADFRLTVGERAFELVSASNLPTHSVLLLRELPTPVAVGS